MWYSEVKLAMEKTYCPYFTEGGRTGNMLVRLWWRRNEKLSCSWIPAFLIFPDVFEDQLFSAEANLDPGVFH